ncbi:hypothetical protein N7449_005841 [Penicillium cf. viridicatum]|uniref:SnoaL-like domain-containing protein n=1 Tax=Penicillium cf. viridicatum TaxID=2972119 RepID=A0A9W9MGS6_9EURO|nr:hypothetical protein N7449_005841 [Penicillium cf. viridicatum]
MHLIIDHSMTATFLPNAIVYHSHDTITSHEERKEILENVYGFFIPGIPRSATNHVVDRDEDGDVIVRYQETLIRYGWSGDNTSMLKREDAVRENGLLAIWWIGTNIDRLRMTSDGWKIFERYLGTPLRNGPNRALDLNRLILLQVGEARASRTFASFGVRIST